MALFKLINKLNIKPNNRGISISLLLCCVVIFISSRAANFHNLPPNKGKTVLSAPGTVLPLRLTETLNSYYRCRALPNQPPH